MNHIARALVLLWLLAGVAAAQVSPSIVTDFPLSGSGSMSNHLRLTNTCAGTQVLAWNGTAWVCANQTGGGGGTGTLTGIVTGATSGLSGGCVLGTCTLTLLTSCAPSQVLQWNGSTWGCASISGGGGGISGLTATKVPVALNSTTLVDGSWTDTGSVLTTTSVVDLMGEQRDGVSYATLPSGITKDWDPFGGGPATPVVVVTVNNSDSTVDSIDASKFSPICLSNKAPKLRIMHDATNHGTLFIVNREGSTSTNLNNKIDLPSNSPTTVAVVHRQVIDLEYQCPLNVWKVIGNQEAMWGGSAGFSNSITDSTLGALVTDYQPAGYDTAAILRLGPSGSSATIASMAARNDSGNRIQFVKCIVALGTLIIQDTTHSSGTAQWRFLLPGNADMTLPPYSTACFRYDAQQTYWMLWNGPGLLTSGGTISGMTPGTLPIAATSTSISNSNETESGGLFRVGSTALTVNYTTGAIVANNSFAITGAANVDTVNPTNTQTGQTTSNALVNAVKLGSFNTTAASLFSFGVRGMAQSSKSAGGNTLFDVGGWFDARNGDANYAIYADAGNVQLNASGGTTTVGGATSLNSTLAVTGATTMSSTLAVTGAISTNSTKWTSGTGVPAIACAIGDLFTRTNGASGSTLYSCTAVNTWTAVGSGGGGVTSITCSTGLSCTAANPIVATGTMTLNINSGSTQTCSAGQHVSALSATGITTCSTDSGGAPSVISPAQLTANTNDWSPTGIATATTVNVDTSNTWQLTGILAGTDGQKLTLHNIGANSFYIMNQSTSSAAANRFLGSSGAYLLQANADAQIEYRGGSTNRWIVQFVGGQFVYDFYALNSFTVGTSAIISGATTLQSTLAVTGAATLSSTLLVGDVTASSVTVKSGIFNDNSSTQYTLSAGCGTGATRGGSNGGMSGRFTTGTGAGSCVVTFSVAGFPFTTAPACLVDAESSTKATYSVSTTAITISSTQSSTVHDFFCIGHQ